MREGIKRPAIIYLMLCLTVTAGCDSGHHKETAPQESANAVKGDVVYQFGDYIETISVAEAAGFDYLETLSHCLMRRPEAMHDLLAMTETAGFDAAASEGHSAVLGYVLRDVGDRFFGECLARESAAVQGAVRKYVLDDIGYGNTSIPEGEIRHLYPKTFPDSCKF